MDFVPFDEDGFDTIVHPNGRLRVPFGWERYEANLVEAYPAEVAALHRYFGVLTAIAPWIDRRVQTSNLKILGALAGMGLTSRWAARPFSSLLDACGFSPELRTVLSTQWLSYACPPSRAPALLHVGSCTPM